MTFQFNGLKAAVTISGSLAVGFPAPASSQTYIFQVYSSANVPTSYTDFYTPTAGKTLYITDIVGVGSTDVFYLSDNGTELLQLKTNADGYISPPFSFNTPLKISTKLQIKCSSSSKQMNMKVIGWEQ